MAVSPTVGDLQVPGQRLSRQGQSEYAVWDFYLHVSTILCNV